MSKNFKIALVFEIRDSKMTSKDFSNGFLLDFCKTFGIMPDEYIIQEIETQDCKTYSDTESMLKDLE